MSIFNPKNEPGAASSSNNNAPKHRCKVAPVMVSSLKENEVFVFGSNERGEHNGGAAAAAVRLFGAEKGRGEGLQGRSYAIPTMGLTIPQIRSHVDKFVRFASENPHVQFLVTKIGCGIAGFTVEQIAPLFREAFCLENVSLPQEFMDYIIGHPLLPGHAIKKVHGQTRTLVDIISEMNKERHFKSAKEVMEAIMEFMRSKKNGPDSVAWNFSLRSLAAFAPKCISAEGLDVERLYDMMEDLFTHQIVGIEAIYKDYAIEKTIKMVEMLNEFRRYQEPKQLLDDLIEIGVSANHCGPQADNYYFSFGSPGGMWGYILFFLERYTSEFWKEFAPDGTLDGKLYKEFMYRRHARGIDKYGLDAVIERNYKDDGPCHPEVFFPYRGGAGPVYNEYRLLDENLRHTSERRWVKSCGEGKGANGVKDWFEFKRLLPVLKKDPKYVILEKGKYDSLLVPKDDVTLPLYSSFFGKYLFTSEEVKQNAIRKIWRDNPNLFKGEN